jgi:hypothetical protein
MFRNIWNEFLAKLGWSNRQAIVFLFFLYLFLSMAFLLNATALTNALLWLTGIVLLLYAVETHGLRLEMLRQNEMAIQPVVIAEVQERGAQNTTNAFARVVILRNIGRGPAIQVTLRVVSHSKAPNAQGVTIDLIEPGKEELVDFTFVPQVDDRSISEPTDFVLLIDPKTARQSYEVEISYKDIGMQEYVSVLRMGKGGNMLLGHGKVGGISSRSAV